MKISFSAKCQYARRTVWYVILMILSGNAFGQQILMFVSQENTYYSEYIVMKEGLEAAGYTVDVRSATSTAAGCYMVAEESGIATSANGLNGSSYSAFQTQFLNAFGNTWNESLNNVPATIPVNGSILDVVNMNNYDALVIPGGTGALAYLVDGSYSAQSSLTAQQVQSVAEKLNALAIDALEQDKPVLAQCHGAGLPAHWRVPSTSGAGAESIGYSLLKGGYATGFPEAATPTTLSSLDITHKNQDRVTVSGVHASLNTNGAGHAKIITTRDWYPQTVAFATKALLNILETYPTYEERSAEISVLLLHGGAVDPGNCGAGNKENDVPCNYGTGENLPADYTDVVSLLQANSANDDYSFAVTQLDLSGTLPFSMTNQSEMETYFGEFDAVIFYKHWSNYLTDQLQNALVGYADDGGGVVALHHGLYNDIDNGQTKDILVNDLFGAQSAQSGWSANRSTYALFSTNHGHFISTFGLDAIGALPTPSVWLSNPPNAAANVSLTYYPSFNLFDEIYNNMTFVNGVTFGSGVNEIQPLFSNNLTPDVQTHVSGFARRFNPSVDASEGKAVYLQPGETIANYDVAHPYGQIMRNAVVWAAKKDEISDPPLSSTNRPAKIRMYPNPADHFVHIAAPTAVSTISIFDITGKYRATVHGQAQRFDISFLEPGLYLVKTDGGSVSRLWKK